MRIAALVLLALGFVADFAHADRGMKWADLMQMRKVYGRTLADDGSWYAFEARPGRGDGEVIVRATRGGDRHVIARGQSPALTSNGEWAAAKVLASFEERETADEPPKSGATLLRLDDGATWDFERVKSFAFSDDGAWFALHFEEDEPDSTETEDTVDTPAEEPAEGSTDDQEEKERTAGTRVTVVRLADQATFEIENVASMAFDPTSNWLALVVATEDGERDRLELRALAGDLPATVVHAAAKHAYPAMTWAEEMTRLAYLRGDATDPEDVGTLTLDVLSPRAPDDLGPIGTFQSTDGWHFPEKNDLRFTRDGARLFVGQRPAEDDGEDDAEASDETESEDTFDPYDVDAILDDREVDVWHWDDPRIKTNEKSTWSDREEHLYRAVVDVDAGTIVPLANEYVPDVRFTENPRIAHGSSDVQYLQLMTWDGFYSDHYVIDLESGERAQFVSRTQDAVSLSPQGRFFAYYLPGEGGQWWLHDVEAGTARRLRPDIGIRWENEDHDYPRTAPGYGVGGWARDDSAVLIYDKYDVWRFPTAGGPAVCLTEGLGRAEQRIYRVLDLDEEDEGLDPEATLIYTGYDDRAKNSSIWRGAFDEAGVEKVREDDKSYGGFMKAEDADVVVYTEESYTEFPDAWVTDTSFRKPRKITEVNPQLDDFDLGQAELVEWTSVDGIPLQGILIKPAGHEEGERYPVLVYYYRFFSQRLHRFNDPQINHRPSFPIYAGDGYAVFLPDIRFDVGNPGYAATKCLVPGMQKIIEMGVADPDGIALHGHSWSGYQTAHVITQTDIFACAVAGAPVSNMTSAYGGIRWGSGLSRQFQYEKTQSRLGANLWQRRDLYIENSPVFFADRIETPLLMQFGDEDEAVPWTQGIEMYMAMRRLDKPAVMLQYRGEPHHLKKYANKLDYSIKMKEFIDHFTKGAPAPAWWTEGVAYTGDAE